MGKYCGCRGKCTCGRTKEIVYPTRKEVRNSYSEETIRHIHPTHTKVINHHTIRNEHFYPHTTSYEERVREVDVKGVRDRGPGSVRGARSPYDDGYGYDGGYRGCGCGCGGRGRCGRRRGGFWC